MENRRKNHPEVVRATDRKRYEKCKNKRNQGVKEWRRKHFFWARLGHLKGVTAKDLAGLWKAQRGRCAYTGVADLIDLRT
jgi:hypothetical protein